MAAENFLTKMANEVLQAADNVATRMEEGLSVIMTGGLPNEGAAAGDSNAGSNIPVQEEEEFDMKDFPEFDNLSEEEIQRIIQDEMMQNSPLAGIADSVLGDIVSGQMGPQTPMEHFHAFRSAITWSETFILSLIAFQITMFFLCLWVARKDRGLTPRITFMLFVGGLVRSAEWLNSWGHRNWESFSKQDYFDKRGIFVGIMLCAPLLVDCFILLFMFLREASQLLVQVKREQFSRQRKGEKEAAGKEAKTTTTTTTGNPKKRSTKTRKAD